MIEQGPDAPQHCVRLILVGGIRQGIFVKHLICGRPVLGLGVRRADRFRRNLRRRCLVALVFNFGVGPIRVVKGEAVGGGVHD